LQRHNDIEEFERAALPHLGDLYRMALRLTGERSRAEDAAQETCLQALRSMERFAPGTNMRAWLFGILFNVIRHQRRQFAKLRLFSESGDDSHDRIAAPPPIPERLTDEGILAALDRVPQPFREVILLVDVEQFAYKEAASILGVPVGTVMSRVSRARSLLRRELADIAKHWGLKAATEGGGQ
jgi:RNA polymerase sigma-70 factor (ECF subfamily)